MTVDWPLAGETPKLDGLDADVKQAVASAAVSYLRRWTGGIYGLTPAVIRPERADALAGSRFGPDVWKWQPCPVDGRWFMLMCGHCGDQFCACLAPKSVRFPFWVHEIQSVTVGGEPFGGWRLDRHRTLTRTDGAGWPPAQNPEFVVTLTRGVPVPAGGQIAAGQLAEEIAKAVTGDTACKLPARVQTITRQGVTVGMLDSMDGLEQGRTGLWLVDSWIASVTEAPRVGGVWSPDRMGGEEFQC